MKEKVIPILFQEYFVSRIYSDDFDDYELNSSSKVQRSLLDDLSEENAHEFFEGVASRIHESSHRDVFYYHHIRCNFYTNRAVFLNFGRIYSIKNLSKIF